MNKTVLLLALAALSTPADANNNAQGARRTPATRPNPAAYRPPPALRVNLQTGEIVPGISLILPQKLIPQPPGAASLPPLAPAAAPAAPANSPRPAAPRAEMAAERWGREIAPVPEMKDYAHAAAAGQIAFDGALKGRAELALTPESSAVPSWFDASGLSFSLVKKTPDGLMMTVLRRDRFELGVFLEENGKGEAIFTKYDRNPMGTPRKETLALVSQSARGAVAEILLRTQTAQPLDGDEKAVYDAILKILQKSPAPDPVAAQLAAQSNWLAQGGAVHTALPLFAGRYEVRRNKPFYWQTAEPRDGYTVSFKAKGGRVRVLDAQPDGNGHLNWRLAVTEGLRPTITLQVHKDGVIRAQVPKQFDAPTLAQFALRMSWQAPLALLIPVTGLAAAGASFFLAGYAATAAADALFGPYMISVVIGWVAGGAAGFGALYGIMLAADRWGPLLFESRFWKKAARLLIPPAVTAGVYVGLPVLIPQLREAQPAAAALFTAMVAVVAGWAAYQGQRALLDRPARGQAVKNQRGSARAGDMMIALGLFLVPLSIASTGFEVIVAAAVSIALGFLMKEI